MRKFMLVLSLICLSASVGFASDSTVEKTLEILHKAASKAEKTLDTLLNASEEQKTNIPSVGESSVEKALNSLHESAAKMDYDTYIGLYSKDAVFFGTAVEERWPYDVFAKYVKERFSAGNGWKYDLISRNIFYSPDKSIAWFDELLQHKAGVARGSGVLIKDGDKWLITQYNLSFPFPNELFGPFLEIVKESGLTKMPK